MGLEQREHQQFLKMGEHSETIINFSYFPQSDRASCVIKQISYDNLKMTNLGDTEIKTIISQFQELKFTREIQKPKFRKWNSWILDEEEIMNLAESMGLDYQIQVQEHIDEIAEKFKKKLSISETEYWEDSIKDAIREALAI